jgi:glycosyltransferase involved in cell wall biosynthesis
LSGVGVYCRRILAGLAAAHTDERFLWCYRVHRLRHGLLEPRPANAAVRPLFESRQVFRAGLFHGLNQRLPARTARRTVCTFHDLFVLTSEYSSAEFRARFAGQARQAAERADLIICVSAFTATQVHELLGVERARLRVVHHGTDLPELPASDPREPLVLHVGALQTRKNLMRLIGAFEQAAPAPWRLVLAGSDGFDAAAVHARIAESAARERIDTPGWVAAEELESLYRRAAVFAFPSLDEGFGIPVLEAMARGVPVLASNRAGLAEACGRAALLVDPFMDDALAEGLRSLIESEGRRAELRLAGLAHASRFPWSKAVEETWAVYGELAGSSELA